MILITIYPLQIRVDRFDSGTRLHNILCIFPKIRHLKQDIVRKFLYTICTQNIGVDLMIPMLMFEGIS
jgi:hypothetical protein